MLCDQKNNNNNNNLLYANHHHHLFIHKIHKSYPPHHPPKKQYKNEFTNCSRDARCNRHNRVGQPDWRARHVSERARGEGEETVGEAAE